MNNYINFKNFSLLIKFAITSIFFISVKDFSLINSFSKLAIALLEFIVILELVKILVEFLLNDKNRIKMGLVIDSTIVFFIRDIMLIVSDTFDSKKVFTILGIIGILFIFRILTIKFSPSPDKINRKKDFVE